jgi:hypothetical protein
MLRLISSGRLLLWSCLLIFGACRKNAAPSLTPHLTDQEKTQLIAKVQADTVFKQWNINQLKVVEAYAKATQQPNFDMQKLQSYKPKNDEELVAALKASGASNAEEILGLNKRSMQLLKELWKKYPQLNNLSYEELLGLNVKSPLNLKQ